MLDKSVPYKNIIMRTEKDGFEGREQPELPACFSFRLFRPGDEKQWARLEWSVDEFPSQKQALDYFCGQYLPKSFLLAQRCWFVWDERKNQAAATATAWFDKIGKDGRTASLHWVSVDPAYQGKGLGKAVTVRALQTLAEKEQGKYIYLHTQTWSHKAVGLYLSLGFRFVKEGGFAQYPNDYPAYLPILKVKMRTVDWESLNRGLTQEDQ